MKSHQFFLQICQVRVQFVVQIDLKYFAHSVFDKTKFSKRRHLFSLNLFVFSDEDVFEAVNFVFPDLQFEFEKLNFSASKPHFLPSAVQTLSQSHFPALSCPPVYNMGENWKESLILLFQRNLQGRVKPNYPPPVCFSAFLPEVSCRPLASPVPQPSQSKWREIFNQINSFLNLVYFCWSLPEQTNIRNGLTGNLS